MPQSNPAANGQRQDLATVATRRRRGIHTTLVKLHTIKSLATTLLFIQVLCFLSSCSVGRAIVRQAKGSNPGLVFSLDIFLAQKKTTTQRVLQLVAAFLKVHP